MPNPSFQTIRLSRGKHRSPDEGACVMELASMLAGEDFSDHPRSVCPVIAAILRGYNDGTDDARRQDLYRFAALAVGTRDRGARRARLARCEQYFEGRGVASGLLVRTRIRAVAAAALDYARTASRAEHERFLGFVEELATADEPLSVPVVGPARPDAPRGVTPPRRARA